MSVSKNTYVIYGYDLSMMRNVLLTEELCESKKYEEMVCCQRKGKIQLFDDPMNGDYLYAGFIVGEFDEYGGDECIKANASNAEMYHAMVDQQLEDWNIHIGVLPFELIVFNEYT
ncbi:hypothetical protein SDC9_46824 [bioreactor metagenome]|uniref:Uncharacterized protein n=1 Tax=bioreactor metagenome TaxID=1076179 RepID=A0A644WAR4_9ZZZZ